MKIRTFRNDSWKVGEVGVIGPVRDGVEVALVLEAEYGGQLEIQEFETDTGTYLAFAPLGGLPPEVVSDIVTECECGGRHFIGERCECGA